MDFPRVQKLRVIRVGFFAYNYYGSTGEPNANLVLNTIDTSIATKRSWIRITRTYIFHIYGTYITILLIYFISRLTKYAPFVRIIRENVRYETRFDKLILYFFFCLNGPRASESAT